MNVEQIDQLLRQQQARPYPDLMGYEQMKNVAPVPSYQERLYHNARGNLMAFRETLRQKDILFGIFYAILSTPLVLWLCSLL
jgi:hypothetical protein